MLDKQRIHEIKERCSKATPGPWYHDGMHDEVHAENYDWMLSEDDLPNHPGAVPIDNFGHRVNPNYVFAAHARQDIPALLAALDEMEDNHRMSVNAAALSIKHLKTARDLYKRRAETLDVELRADRDRWQKRAEALERAIKGLPIGKVSCPACKLCASYDYAYAGTLRSCTNKTATCGINNGYNSWQFDEARFSGGE